MKISKGLYMTLPDQRTRALIGVHDFLLRLASPYGRNGLKKIPQAVRMEARRLLRHFPTPQDVMHPKQWDQSVIDAYYTRLAEDWKHDAIQADRDCD